jgi:ABC-type branched-subunit amino acid transport system permease subunit
LAAGLSIFGHRTSSVETMSPAFSDQALAIVLIGEMRSFAGPIFGLVFIVFLLDCRPNTTPSFKFTERKP